jgi:hypothetical protein
VLPVARSLKAVAVLALVAAPSAATAQGAGPPEHRVYPLVAGTARVPVPAGPGNPLWRVQDEAGRHVRDWAPADPDGAVRVPKGGWFRLLRRNAASGEEQAVGGRFAAGLVIVVTGQSQADSFFRSDDASVGAFAAGAGDPPLPAVTAVLQECGGAMPDCGPGGTAWARRRTRSGAGCCSRNSRGASARCRSRWRMAPGAGRAPPNWRPGNAGGPSAAARSGAAAPASAALVLAHGTTDALRGTSPERYGEALARINGVLRAGAAGTTTPVLLAPLPPLAGPTRLLGSGRLAAWTLPTEGAPAWMLRAGIASMESMPDEAKKRVEAIRAAQHSSAAALGLLPGGDTTGVAPGLDGVHWPPGAVREAARRAAAALAEALPPP